MANDKAELLAQEIADDVYKPNEIINCQPILPLDENSHTVRFQQLMLFSTPRLDVRSPDDPAYLILQQFQATEAGRKPIRQKFIGPLATEVHSKLGSRPTRASLAAALAPLQRAGFSVAEAMMADIKDLPGALESVLTKALLPDPYQPFQTPYPHFALCATYEQEWQPSGYTRGELISSISLAPGEQLTLDIHSWDKSTIKSEDELASESELRVSENLTERDVHTVTRELSKQMGGNLNASATVPIYGIPVSFGGGVSGSISSRTQSTTEKLRERTVQASHTLKNTRKLRIEISREVGREQRQTRVVANTNRCHTLNCYYFEIIANYLVTTRRLSLEPCLLLPLPKVAVTAPWILSHEDVLKQALLDKVFLDGFEGARTLETSEEFEEITKEQASVDLKAYVDSILLSYDTLLAAVDAFRQKTGEQLPNAGASLSGSQGSAMANALGLTQEQLRQVLYMAMLATDLLAWNALKKLKQDIQPVPPPGGTTAPPARAAVDALKDFLAVVGPNSYRAHWNASLTTGLAILSISPGVFFSLIAWGFIVVQPDDAELFVAVKAANKKMKAIAKAAEDQPAPPPGGFAVMDLAKARVAFESLKTHIEDNWVYYFQALWRREDSDQRFLRLQGYGAIAAIVENNMIGFLGHKAAFLITNTKALTAQIDFDAIIDATPDDQPAPAQLISLPTSGSLLEAMVGECDACEEFIRHSRGFDLRVQKAKALEEESEAKRYQTRVESGDYSDPRALSSGKVVINVGGEEPATPP